MRGKRWIVRQRQTSGTAARRTIRLARGLALTRRTANSGSLPNRNSPGNSCIKALEITVEVRSARRGDLSGSRLDHSPHLGSPIGMAHSTSFPMTKGWSVVPSPRHMAPGMIGVADHEISVVDAVLMLVDKDQRTLGRRIPDLIEFVPGPGVIAALRARVGVHVRAHADTAPARHSRLTVHGGSIRRATVDRLSGVEIEP